jgi:WD40 repeat protein
VTLVSVVAAAAVYQARGLAEKQRYRAECRLANSDLDRGLSFCEQGDAARGLLWLARGLNDAPPEAADLRHCIRMNLESWSRECYPPLLCLEHGSAVYAVAFSPDGKTIATGSADGTARLWDTATGKPVGSPLNHVGDINAVAFSPDCRIIATGSADRTARLWDAATGKPLGPPMNHLGDINAVAFSPDGKTIATGSRDNTARLWDAATGKPLGPPMAHQAEVLAVAFSPDGKTIATGSGDRTARLWDMPSPVEDNAKRIIVWIRFLTNMELDSSDAVSALDGRAWSQLRHELAVWK